MFKLINIVCLSFFIQSCSMYSHNNQTLIHTVKVNGDNEYSNHFHDLTIVSWRKIDDGALRIDKNGAIKGSADKIDTDVAAVELLNNLAKMGVKLVSPGMGAADILKPIIEQRLDN